jgi:ubiquinone biosynthesis protein
MGIIEDIERFTLSELDLRHEVTGQETLRNIHSEAKLSFDLSGLIFPQVHSKLSHKNMMVSEYVPGPTFDELLSAGKLKYAQLLDLFRIQGYYMFCKGVFHGDLHPGNIILSDSQLCFIDTGFIAKVGRKMRVGLFNFFEALSSNHYEKCAYALNSMSDVEIKGTKLKEFITSFQYLYRDFTGANVARVSLTQKMMETIKLGIHAGMSFERGIFSVIRSLMYLDGMVLRCNPEAVLLEDMRQYIGEFKAHI